MSRPPPWRLWLHTCTFDHPAALSFYQRAGFCLFRRQIEVEDDPRLDGTALRDVAKHVPVIEYPLAAHKLSSPGLCRRPTSLNSAKTWMAGTSLAKTSE